MLTEIPAPGSRVTLFAADDQDEASEANFGVRRAGVRIVFRQRLQFGLMRLQQMEDYRDVCSFPDCIGIV
jgi:hypothetical protein